MADNFADFYSGNMAPPLRLPGGGYAPAPSVQTQMTPEEIYQGIYGEPISTGLSSRSVRTVAIDPTTGMPASQPQMTADARAAYGGGIGAGASGSLTMPPRPLPNQPSGSIRMAKDQSRLPQTSRDADLLSGYSPMGGNSATSAIASATRPPMTAIGGARGQLGAMGNMSGSLSMGGGRSGGIIDLSALNMSDQGAQGIADSEGKPIRAANGKVYYPGGKAPQPASGMPTTGKEPGPLGKLMGLKQGGLSGLLSGMIGGFNMSNGGRAGASTVPGLGALLSGGGSSFGSSPSQGRAMTVDTNTSTGSTLAGMGYSPGAAIPKATIDNLRDRGYI